MGELSIHTTDRGDRHPLDLSRAWLIILAFAIQLAVIPTVSDPSALALKKAVLVVTGVMLIVGIVPNLHLWSVRVIVLGFVLNAAAISLNGGLMPITPENQAKVFGVEALPEIGQTPAYSKNVLLEADDTKVGILSDRIYIGGPSPRVYSIGDFVLVSGLLLFGIEAVVVSLLLRKRSKVPSPRRSAAILLEVQ